MFAVMLGYGMSETTAAVILNPPNCEVVPGSVGFVLPNTEAKVCTVVV